jgi:fatty acid desaturase
MQLHHRARISWRRFVPLRYAADWRTLLFLGALILICFVQWTGVIRHWSLLAISAALSFVACVIKHNQIHCRTFLSRGWNRAFEFALGLCTGQPTTAIISIHNERHHGGNQSERDCVRSSLAPFHSNALNLLVFPFAAALDVRRHKGEDMKRWRTEHPRRYRELICERIVVNAFLAALLIADWRSTLIYLGVPMLFGQWCIVAINYIQHQGCDPKSAHDHSRNLTGAIVNWLFLNNGYHTAHHERPALHWSFLPEYHAREIRPRMEPRLDEPSLGAFLWRHLTQTGA